MNSRLILTFFVAIMSFAVVVPGDVPVINVSKPKEKSKLQTAMDRIDTLQDMVNKYIDEVDTLRAEKVTLTKTVNGLKAKNKKLKATAGGKGDKESEVDYQLEAEKAEEYFRRETGQLAQEMYNLNRQRHELEKELESCRQTKGCGISRQQQQQQPSCDAATGNLQEKLTNCDETVKVVRERCADDQEQLRRTQNELVGVRKECGNCSAELADCENMKGYLEFLKRGYEVVVPDLENEAKEAKENKQKSEDDAENAFKVAASARLYLTIFFITMSIFGAVKFYRYVAGVLQRHQQMAAAAKAEEKLNKLSKRKRR